MSLRFPWVSGPHVVRRAVRVATGVVVMLERASDDEVIIERVAAIDIGKSEVVCAVRVSTPGRAGQRSQEARSFSTVTRSLLVMGDWLAGLGVTQVVIEATSDDWNRPVRGDHRVATPCLPHPRCLGGQARTASPPQAGAVAHE